MIIRKLSELSLSGISSGVSKSRGPFNLGNYSKKDTHGGKYFLNSLVLNACTLVAKFVNLMLSYSQTGKN